MNKMQDKSSDNIRKMRLKSGFTRADNNKSLQHSKLDDDEKPEPHLPRNQERDKRVKSAFRNVNMKLYDNRFTDTRSNDGRSSVCLSSHYSKMRSSAHRVGPNHYLAHKNEPPMPAQFDQQSSTTGYVRNHHGVGTNHGKEDIVSVISAAKSLLSDGHLNSSLQVLNYNNGAMAGENMSSRPTSSYLCSGCKI